MRGLFARWATIVRSHDWHLAALVLGIAELARGSALGFVSSSPALIASLSPFGGYERAGGPLLWATLFLSLGAARVRAVYDGDALASAWASFAACAAFGFLAYLGVLTTGLSTGPAIVHHAVAAAHSLASALVYIRAKRDRRNGKA